MNSRAGDSVPHNFGLNVEAETRVAALGGIDGIDVQIAIYVEALKVLRSRRNLLAPISRLPQEILAHIFSCLSRVHPFSLKWLSVTHTCKLWRQTALDTPELWSHINAASRKDIIEAFLERSKAAELVVRVAEHHPYVDLHVSNYKLVLEHWSRIRNLKVVFPNYIDESWQNLHGALPCASRMRSLHLTKKILVSGDVPILPGYAPIDCSDITQTTPSLRSLSLTGFYFSWTSSTLRNLSELVLESIEDDSKRPTIVDILNILALSPSLKLLILNGVGPSDSPTDSLIHVGLSNLRTLKLLRIDAFICIKLLQNMELPKSVKWDIECLNYPILEPKIIYPHFTSSLAVCDRLSISLGLKNIFIKTFSSNVPNFAETRLALRWDLSNSSINFSKLFNALSVNINNYIRKDMSALEIRILDPDIINSKEQWLELMHGLNELQHLICYFDYQDHRLNANTEECLAEALMHTVSPGVVIFPELIQLQLHFANFSQRRGNFKDLLVDCLISREDNNSLLETLMIRRANGIEVEDAEQLESYVEELDWDEEVYSEDSEDEEDESEDDHSDSDEDNF